MILFCVILKKHSEKARENNMIECKIERLIEETALAKKAKQAKYLFHGSPKKLDRILPKPSFVINNEKAIFAAPREMALVFLNRWDDRDVKVGTVNGQIVIKEIPGRKSIKELFKGGGWLYKFDKKFFKNDHRLGPWELISKKEVPYISREYIPSALEEMKKYDIKFIYAKASI